MPGATDGGPAWKKVKSRKQTFSSSSGGPEPSGSSVPTTRAGAQPTPESSEPFRMPPIVLDAPKAWHAFAKSIKQAAAFPIDIYHQGKLLRIKTRTPDEFRFVQKTLIDSNVQFHTFGLHQEKEIKITIRGIPYDVAPTNIIEELESLGFTPTSCIPLVDRQKRKVNVFFIKLKKVGDYQLIYSLRELLCLRIEVSRYNTPTGPPQCYNCQRYGHTGPLCVRCGEGHPKGSCTKDPNTDAKCANCKQNHPANWRGCEHYQSALERKQEMEEIRHRNPTRPQRQIKVQQTATPAAAPAHQPPVQPRRPSDDPTPATTEPPSTVKSFAAAAASKPTSAPQRAKAPKPKPKQKPPAAKAPSKKHSTAQQLPSVQPPNPEAAPATSKPAPQPARRPAAVSEPDEGVLTIAELQDWMEDLLPKLVGVM